MKKSVLWVVILLVLVIGGGWYLTNNKTNTEPSVPSVVDREKAEEIPVLRNEVASLSGTNTPVKEVTVEGSNFKLVPTEIKVKKGETVKVTFKNIQGFHDFVIDGFNVATKKFNAGSEETIQFIADKTGSFEYYCSISTHKAQGMKGTLIVE